MIDNEIIPIDIEKYAEALNNLIGVDSAYFNGDKDVNVIIEIITLAKKMESIIKRQQAEIERLRKYNTDVAFKHYNDGIKEFAERFKETDGYDNHIFDKCASILVSKEYVKGRDEKIKEMLNTIDKLVKEMTEGAGMTTLEYMKRELQKHRLNYERESARGVPEEQLQNIQRKINHYEAAVDALKNKVEVKHGMWINQDDTFTKVMCSNCDARNYSMRYDFCPHCGAKMDGKELGK